MCTNCCVGSSYGSVIKKKEGGKKNLSDLIVIRQRIYTCWFTDKNVTVFLHPTPKGVFVGTPSEYPGGEVGPGAYGR